MTEVSHREEERKKKRNCVVVGIKLDSSGRELLTWTLAKYTESGDHVIALHVASSAAQADAARQKLVAAATHQADAISNLGIGAFESFCKVKEIDLELKIIHGYSQRSKLIEEAKSCSASRLVLGTSKRALPLMPFSLAKYCAKRLPYSCSILVIENGRAVFEKEGDMKDAVLNKMWKSVRSQSCKGTAIEHNQRRDLSKCSALRQIDWKRASTSDAPVWHSDASQNSMHSGPLESMFVVSPACLIDTVKQNPLQVQMTDSGTSSLDMRSSIFTSRSEEESNSGRSSLTVVELSDGRAGQQAGILDASKHCGPQSQAESDVELDSQQSVEGSLDTPLPWLEEQTKLHCEMSKDPTSPPGWPLLHRSISMCTSNDPGRPRHLSAVEWALQLPDRPMEHFKNYADFACTRQFLSHPLHKLEGVSSEETQRDQHCRSKHDNDSVAELSFDGVAAIAEGLCHSNVCQKFQFQELKAATDGFCLGNLIGKGGFSEVYRGMLSDGCQVAVKRFGTSSPDAAEVFATEVEILSELHHSHIVHLLGYCVDSDFYMLVYTLAVEGSLEHKLHASKGSGVLPWDARHKVAVGVAEALNYLHDNCPRPVIHRDVKSSNILLLSDLQPQLTDFGIAKWMATSTAQITCSDVVGTFGYLAPEYFMFGKVSEKTDVYSFGVVLLELITGRHPIDAGSPKGQENLVLWAKPLLEDDTNTVKLIDSKLDGAYDVSQLKQMMIAAAYCLRQSPHSRPSMRWILGLLTGQMENVDVIVGQELGCCKDGAEEGDDVPEFEEHDIRKHLTIALLGLDDDDNALSHSSSLEYSMNFTCSNTVFERYLGGRYSRSGSFD